METRKCICPNCNHEFELNISSNEDSNHKAELRKKDLEFQELTERHKKTLRDIEKLKNSNYKSPNVYRGSAQEIVVTDIIKNANPQDFVEKISNTKNNADIIQKVFDKKIERGTILYESKRTNRFSRIYYEKLKKDMGNTGAEIGVIVTQALPPSMIKDNKTIDIIEGVYVCHFSVVETISILLRKMILLAHSYKSKEVSTTDLKEKLYRYFTSDKFKDNFELIHNSYSALKLQLEKEKKETKKHWEKREQIINNMIESTAIIEGNVDGILALDSAKNKKEYRLGA